MVMPLIEQFSCYYQVYFWFNESWYFIVPAVLTALPLEDSYKGEWTDIVILLPLL